MTDEQIAELADNLDCGFRCFVHKETKTIVTTSDFENDLYSDADLWAEVNEKIEHNFDSYVEIEKMDSNESFRLMQNFIESIQDNQLRDKLDQALNKRKPFRNFKFEIDNSGSYRQKWFDFKKQQLIEWVKGQLTASDL